MKNRWFAVVVVLVTVAWLPVGASAEGWLPNVNPFGSKKAEPSVLSGKTSSSSSDDSSWSMSGKKPQSSARSTSEPSTWDKFASGTSNAVKKTGSYLNPWHKETAPPPKPSGSRGYKSSARSASSKKTTTETTWYNPTTWFGSSEPAPKKIDSVPGFLGQSRPKN